MSAAKRATVWQELIEIASNAANKQLDALATRLANALLTRTASTVPGEAEVRAEAAGLLKKNRYLFYYTVSERLAAVLRNEVQALACVDLPSSAVAAAKPLAPDLEIDKKLSLIKLSRSIESEHANRLMVLSSRLACLLGRDELSVAQNPFRPHVFLAALQDAWCDFHPDAKAHHLAFRIMGPDLCIDVGPIFHALNTALVRHGILAAPAEPFQPAPPAELEPEAGGDIAMQQLHRLFPTAGRASREADLPLDGDLPSLFGTTTLHAASSRHQLLSYLAEIQKNGPDPHQAGTAAGVPGASLLAHVRRWAPPGALTDEDGHTIALLIPVFDAVFGARTVPAEIKTLIGSLQIPLLKATLNDKDFFFKPNHPARRVIELMAHIGISWERANGPRDPLYQTILRNVKRIQSDQRMPSFSDAVAELEACAAEQDAGTTETLTVSIAQALEQEKRLQATKAARHEVALRVGTGEVVAFVETFLEDKWVSVLTLAYSVKDDKPQALDSAIRTMDDLCWSVKPKITPEERKNLLAKLPNIIAMLNKWLDLIKWNDAARVKFFDDLAKCHASIVRAPLELSPERQMMIAVAVAKKAAERRLQRQARQQPEPAPDAFDQQVQQLARGTWLEFDREGAPSLTVKLAWISPMRSLFIFATATRQEALSLSDEELAGALREGRARIALEAGLVARALEQALAGDGATNDAATGQAAA
ncbi:MAG TPA: DUF1631 family protein [Noviherbaspirillum sp.]|nr:DUF1631 family protein [Noviherbaspirillum sp.]